MVKNEKRGKEGDRRTNVPDKKDDKKISRPKKEEAKKITNVYSADFSIIDACLENIKKEARKQGTNEYACNNIYIMLEETLKRVKLSNN